MKRNKSWIHRQKNDHYVKSARKDNYRSRAVYKLQEIDEKDRLIRPGMYILDLGAAPGGWSQYASKKITPGGKLIAIDRLEMIEIPDVEFILGDILDEQTIHKCISLSGHRQIDLVISDIAPNLTGIRDTDQARSLELAKSVVDVAFQVLKPGGGLLIKLFEGSEIDSFRNELTSKFQRVMVRKPRASRDSSREIYMLGCGYEI